MSSGDDGRPEPTRWTIHDERLVDDTRRLRLSIAQVELPDGVRFEQYVLRMPKAPMTVLLNADFENLTFLSEGAEDTGAPADVNKAARIGWITLDSVGDRIPRGEISGG